MISRLDLDGVGSSASIAARIHELQPDLPLDFSIEALCKQLDIADIEDKPVTSFAAMLLMHPDKAWGSIVVAQGSSAKRRRFSIGHELGHFLIPSHRPQPGQQFSCSDSDLRLSDTKEKDRHRRIEAEANRFAAHLLMPPARIRMGLRSRRPDLGEVVRLAGEFRVSKEAMARGYVESHPETLAVVMLRYGRIDRMYRSADFPWIDMGPGQGVPEDSTACGHRLLPGEITEMEACDPETWLSEYHAARVEFLSEQVLAQRDGYATVLLHAEMAD